MIAILSDIHSNIQALDAVLEDIPKEVSEIWVLGDTVGGMASPCETLDRLMNLSIPVTSILGNWEESFLAVKKGLILPQKSDKFANIMGFTYDALQAHHWAFLEELSSTLSIDTILGGAFLSHAKPWDCRDGIDTEEDAKEAAASRTEKWLFSGHYHHTRSFRVGNQRVVCVGSVGLSMDGIGGMACYTLLDGDKLSFKHVDYDVDAAINDLKNCEAAISAPGFVTAYVLGAASGQNYTQLFMDFAQAYDGTWEEAERAWVESLE